MKSCVCRPRCPRAGRKRTQPTVFRQLTASQRALKPRPDGPFVPTNWQPPCSDKVGAASALRLRPRISVSKRKVTRNAAVRASHYLDAAFSCPDVFRVRQAPGCSDQSQTSQRSLPQLRCTGSTAKPCDDLPRSSVHCPAWEGPVKLAMNRLHLAAKLPSNFSERFEQCWR